MHRMRRLIVPAGLIAIVVLGFADRASAALLRPNDQREFPDITAFANGSQTYSYDASTGTGLFQLTNLPFLLTTGKTSSGGFDEYDVTKTDAGMRLQTVTAVLDSNGKLVESDRNSFQLYGKVVVGDQTYTGLLLQGTPTAFGSEDLGKAVSGEDVFDLQLKITGGVLAANYGPDAYIRVTSEANSTFQGVFTSDFASEKVLTNTHRTSSPIPPPVPEPTTLVVLLACGAGLFYRGRRRISTKDLGA
jgi:hypothetical protein